jgi:hypothetical protein
MSGVAAAHYTDKAKSVFLHVYCGRWESGADRKPSFRGLRKRTLMRFAGVIVGHTVETSCAFCILVKQAFDVFPKVKF